jgi:hypothetical protein
MTKENKNKHHHHNQQDEKKTKNNNGFAHGSTPVIEKKTKQLH